MASIRNHSTVDVCPDKLTMSRNDVVVSKLDALNGVYVSDVGKTHYTEMKSNGFYLDGVAIVNSGDDGDTITASHIKATKTLVSDGTLVVGGDSTLAMLTTDAIQDNGALIVTGTSYLGRVQATYIADSGDLNVTGLTTLMTTHTNQLTSTSITSNGTLDVTGATTLTDVLADSLLSSAVTSTGDLTVLGGTTLGVTGTGALTATSITDGGTLSVTGLTTLTHVVSGSITMGASADSALTINNHDLTPHLTTGIVGTLSGAATGAIGDIWAYRVGNVVHVQVPAATCPMVGGSQCVVCTCTNMPEIYRPTKSVNFVRYNPRNGEYANTVFGPDGTINFYDSGSVLYTYSGTAPLCTDMCVSYIIP